MSRKDAISFADEAVFAIARLVAAKAWYPSQRASIALFPPVVGALREKNKALAALAYAILWSGVSPNI
jgi:hypothetical protein